MLWVAEQITNISSKASKENTIVLIRVTIRNAGSLSINSGVKQETKFSFKFVVREGGNL